MTETHYIVKANGRKALATICPVSAQRRAAAERVKFGPRNVRVVKVEQRP